MARFRLTLGQLMAWVAIMAVILATYTASVRPERRGRTLLQVAIIAGSTVACLLAAWWGGSALARIIWRLRSSDLAMLPSESKSYRGLLWACRVAVGLAVLGISGPWVARMAFRIGPLP